MDLVINFDSHDQKRRLYDTLKDQRGDMIVKIVRPKKRRSIKQNKYYWGCVIKYLQEEIGEVSGLVVHEYMKAKFIPWVKFEDDFKLSTADMTKEEIWDYIGLIREWALEFLNLLIPEPEQWTD